MAKFIEIELINSDQKIEKIVINTDIIIKVENATSDDVYYKTKLVTTEGTHLINNEYDSIRFNLLYDKKRI